MKLQCRRYSLFCNQYMLVLGMLVTRAICTIFQVQVQPSSEDGGYNPANMNPSGTLVTFNLVTLKASSYTWLSGHLVYEHNTVIGFRGPPHAYATWVDHLPDQGTLGIA